MIVTDPIADMLTRIRNGGKAGLPEVTMPSSRVKAAIAAVLKEDGYVDDWRVDYAEKKQLTVVLKYRNGKLVIDGLKRISKSSCRVYANTKEIPRVLDGLGIAILSTSRGIMSDRAARRENVGGEVLCHVW